NSVPAKRLFTSSKEINQGMKESNRLALTMKGVINRSLDDLQGFISEFQCENEIYLACQSMNVCLFIINDLLISF
ncbi:hypothetical protein MJL48_32600, partial [Salmonella enterica subsp. enterica serovar Kentucky]|nr:hypothetical protein [Salmonella enterica subsp. enterica serovar Kentucky]